MIKAKVLVGLSSDRAESTYRWMIHWLWLWLSRKELSDYKKIKRNENVFNVISGLNVYNVKDHFFTLTGVGL